MLVVCIGWMHTHTYKLYGIRRRGDGAVLRHMIRLYFKNMCDNFSADDLINSRLCGVCAPHSSWLCSCTCQCVCVSINVCRAFEHVSAVNSQNGSTRCESWIYEESIMINTTTVSAKLNCAHTSYTCISSESKRTCNCCSGDSFRFGNLIFIQLSSLHYCEAAPLTNLCDYISFWKWHLLIMNILMWNGKYENPKDNI